MFLETARRATHSTRSKLAFLFALLVAASCTSSRGDGFGEAPPETRLPEVPPPLGDAESPATPCSEAEKSPSTAGCHFAMTMPATYKGVIGCYALFVTNVAAAPAKLSLTRDGQAFQKQFVYLPHTIGGETTYEPAADNTVPVGGVAIALLVDSTTPSEYAACPAAPAMYLSGSQQLATGTIPAFSLETSQPVVAADIYPFGGANSYVTSASILLPQSTWGRSTVVATPSFIPSIGHGDESWTDILAAEDSVITLKAKRRLEPSRFENSKPITLVDEQTMTIDVKAGQAFHLSTPSDLTGTILTSDKPFLATGGHVCFITGRFACDGAHQQLSSSRLLGSEYVAVGHRDRIEGLAETHKYRIVGIVDGTSLVYEPARPDGAPEALNLSEDAVIDATSPFIVRSQDAAHPFFFAEYMTGCFTVDEKQEHGCPGDPEFIASVTPEQFASHYDFFTDPTYPTTHLVVTRQRGESGSFGDVRLECLGGPLSGWQPLGDRYEYARLDLASATNCTNGRQSMSSDAPFGVTVWGWGRNVTDAGVGKDDTGATSYALPASFRLVELNDVTIR